MMQKPLSIYFYIAIKLQPFGASCRPYTGYRTLFCIHVIIHIFFLGWGSIDPISCLLDSSPSLFFWYIWLDRNEIKHNNNTEKPETIVQQILTYIQKAQFYIKLKLDKPGQNTNLHLDEALSKLVFMIKSPSAQYQCCQLRRNSQELEWKYHLDLSKTMPTHKLLIC